jgi:hypothetical protein
MPNAAKKFFEKVDGKLRRAPEATKKFFEKVDEKLRKTRFVNRIVSVYEGVGKPGEENEYRSASPYLHPIQFYHDVAGTDVGKLAGKNEPSPVGEAIRWRIVNGPELNILLCGIPFLIDFGVSGIAGAVKKSKKKKRLKHNQRTTVRVEVEKPFSLNLKNRPAPLNSAPFSNEAQTNLYLALIDAGMSEDGARKVASGEFEGLEVSEHCTPEDTEVLADFLTSDNVKKFDLELVD